VYQQPSNLTKNSPSLNFNMRFLHNNIMSGQTKEVRIFMAVKALQNSRILDIHGAAKGTLAGCWYWRHADKRHYILIPFL